MRLDMDVLIGLRLALTDLGLDLGKTCVDFLGNCFDKTWYLLDWS